LEAVGLLPFFIEWSFCDTFISKMYFLSVQSYIYESIFICEKKVKFM